VSEGGGLSAREQRGSTEVLVEATVGRQQETGGIGRENGGGG
jgi:hypothetical protein